MEWWSAWILLYFQPNQQFRRSFLGSIHPSIHPPCLCVCSFTLRGAVWEAKAGGRLNYLDCHNRAQNQSNVSITKDKLHKTLFVCLCLCAVTSLPRLLLPFLHPVPPPPNVTPLVSSSSSLSTLPGPLPPCPPPFGIIIDNPFLLRASSPPPNASYLLAYLPPLAHPPHDAVTE